LELLCVYTRKGRLGNGLTKGVLERVGADRAIIVPVIKKTSAFCCVVESLQGKKQALDKGYGYRSFGEPVL